MCLETITHGPNPEEEGEGYKIFECVEEDGSLVGGFTLYKPNKGQPEAGKSWDWVRDCTSYDRFTPQFKPGAWLNDPNNYQIKSEWNGNYETGFHLFVNKEDAEIVANYFYGIVRKVRYKNVTAKGTQSFSSDPDSQKYPAIVAREIFIEEET
jgi:hypothetical protein